MIEQTAQASAIILAGASLGWIMLFSFVVSPAAYKTFDQGRAERLVKQVMNSGHGILGLIALASAAAALISGALAGAVVAAVAGVFAFMCKFALAPREDKPLKGHRVLKTARIVASGLTAFIMPVLGASIVLTLLGI
jgi:cellobiose-specific phosphotransferase system component IIC